MSSENSDYISNNQIHIPDVVEDVGTLLRNLRNNHGYTTLQLSKRLGLPPKTISDIELSKRDIPPENVMRKWLSLLGCGRNTNKIIQITRQFRVKHWITLHRNESSNPNMIRLLDAYRNGTLSDYDRALLTLIAR